jgi:hypothetical protein
MNRRHFFRLLWGASALAFFQKNLKSASSPAQVANPTLSERARRERLTPLHECVDRPNLPCPACMKWTGDGFATVRSNP